MIWRTPKTPNRTHAMRMSSRTRCAFAHRVRATRGTISRVACAQRSRSGPEPPEPWPRFCARRMMDSRVRSVQRKRVGNNKGRCPPCNARAGRAKARGPYVSGCAIACMHVKCYRAAWQRRQHSSGAGISAGDAGAWALHGCLCGGCPPTSSRRAVRKREGESAGLRDSLPLVVVYS